MVIFFVVLIVIEVVVLAAMLWAWFWLHRFHLMVLTARGAILTTSMLLRKQTSALSATTAMGLGLINTLPLWLRTAITTMIWVQKFKQ